MANFMIEFKALAMKVDTDDLYAIFLLKKNIQVDIIKTILGYSPIAVSKSFLKMEGGNHLSWTRLQINRRTT